MKRVLTGSLLVALLALVAFVGNAAATEYIYVHNASGSAINKGCPVGTDTGTVAMVTAVHVGADTTTTLTLLSKLHTIALPAVQASRAYWTVKARFNTAATDTFTRTLHVFGRDVANGLHDWSFAFDTSDIGTYVIPWNIAKVESAKFTGKATTDTIQMYAEAFYSVTGITATTVWTHPFIGVAAETILAQNRGRVAVLGEASVYLSAAAKPGYVVYPGTATTAMDAAFATPDSGGFVGFVRVPTTAAGFATCYIVPQYMGVPNAIAFAGHVTCTDVIASDTLKGATLVSTGKAAITGRITGSDVQVTDSILGVTGDFSGVVSPLSVTLPGGGTIANPASPGTTVTITETNIALAGAVTATTAAIGSSGSVLSKVWVTGTGASDSLLFVAGNDTFVATQVRVGH